MASASSSSSSAAAAPARVLTWSRPPSQGACPSGRGGHSASQVGNLMLLFGGTFFDAGSFHYLNDLWALDVESLKWHKPALGGGGGGRAPPCPGPRYGHSAVVVDWSVFVFGGKGEGGVMYNDLWCLSVDTWTWELMPTTSSPPSPRMGHACAAVDGKLVVSLGWDSQKTCFSDVWVYDRALFSWSRPKVSGLAPPMTRLPYMMGMAAASRPETAPEAPTTKTIWPQCSTRLASAPARPARRHTSRKRREPR